MQVIDISAKNKFFKQRPLRFFWIILFIFNLTFVFLTILLENPIWLFTGQVVIFWFIVYIGLTRDFLIDSNQKFSQENNHMWIFIGIKFFWIIAIYVFFFLIKKVVGSNSLINWEFGVIFAVSLIFIHRLWIWWNIIKFNSKKIS